MNANNSYQLMPHSAIIPFQTRYESALKEPITQRCYALSQLIQESIANNIKDIQLNFSSLIEDIFSFGTHSLSDWGLKLISRNLNPREFDTIFAFLNVNGIVFQLIRQLMNDPINRYEFPTTRLPMATKLSLEEGVIPNFYVNKITHGFANSISLNAFEFYLFHFGHYMLDNSPNLYGLQQPYYLEQINNANSNPSNIIYFALLESYLNYFVPLSNTETAGQQQVSHPSLWQSLSSTTSNLLHLGGGSPTQSVKQVSSPQTSTLFKSSILNSKPLLSSTSNSNDSEHSLQRVQYDPLGTQINKCESVLLIFTEIWLNHAIPSSLNKKQISPSRQTLFTPNADHMRVVRILIKHLHYFANSYNKRLNESMHIIDTMPLDDIKRSIWSSKYVLQKKLYTFLRLSFERWPNDSSFRLPLETWLSYIQPWRYSTSGNRDMNGDDRINSANTTQDNVCFLDYQWKQFISDNLLFYTVIFRQVIPRFSKLLLELSTSKNALMLFRLTKVFSQQNLWRWIKEAEDSLFMTDSSVLPSHSWSTVSTSRTSLLSPSIRQPNINSMVGKLRHHLMEMESNAFEYTPLFSPVIKSLIMQLLTEISKAIAIVDEVLVSTKCESEKMSASNFSTLGFIKSIFQSNEESLLTDELKRVLQEKNKTKCHLQIALNQLSQLFEVPEPQSILADSQVESAALSRSQSSDFSAIQSQRAINRNLLYEDESGTPKLTAFGRYQMLNRLHKPDASSLEGNPDEQPIRTYEFYYLVRLMLFISQWINQRYGRYIIDIYNRPSFVGVFCRQLICSPTEYVKIVKSTENRPPNRMVEELPPRVNLRFVANRTYLYYALFVITVVYLLNYSLISFSFLSFVMFLTYKLTKSVLIYLSLNNA